MREADLIAAASAELDHLFDRLDRLLRLLLPTVEGDLQVPGGGGAEAVDGLL